MTITFEGLAKNFHEINFNEKSLEFSEPLTAQTWTPSANLLLGDLKGNLHNVNVSSSIPTVSDTSSIANSRITDIAVNLSGDMFACTSFGSNDIHIGEVGFKEIGNSSPLQSSEKPICVSFLEDQRSRQCLLLMGGKRGIRVHDIESGGLFRTLESKSIFTSLFSWSGCMLMSGTSDGEVCLWDIRRPQVIATFGKRSAVSGRAIFSVDSGARLLSFVAPDGLVEFHDIGAHKLITRKKILDSQPCYLSFSRKCRFLAISNCEKLNLVNLNDFSMSPLPFPSKTVKELNKFTGIAWHPTNCEIATRSTDKKLRLFTAEVKEKAN